MINVCVPVLKRYDLLRELLASLAESLIEPSAVYVIDNGLNEAAVKRATDGFLFPIVIHTPEANLGVAASWNWFIENASEERVICNDDVTFAPDSLEKLIAPSADIIWAKGCGFSCFVLRDGCVEKLGVFDETISPGYGYYEDDDYLMRLDGRGTRPPKARAAEADCGVAHAKSQTLAARTPEEMEEHHRLFWIAQTNYVNKWGLQREFSR